MDRDKLIEQAIEYRARWYADDTDFRNGYELAADFAIEYAAEQVRAERIAIANRLDKMIDAIQYDDAGNLYDLRDELRGEG